MSSKRLEMRDTRGLLYSSGFPPRCRMQRGVARLTRLGLVQRRARLAIGAARRACRPAARKIHRFPPTNIAACAAFTLFTSPTLAKLSTARTRQSSTQKIYTMASPSPPGSQSTLPDVFCRAALGVDRNGGAIHPETDIARPTTVKRREKTTTPRHLVPPWKYCTSPTLCLPPGSKLTPFLAPFIACDVVLLVGPLFPGHSPRVVAVDAGQL